MTSRQRPAEALPAGFLVQAQDARDELAIFMPGRHAMAKYCTVILRLLDAGTPVNLARLRHEIQDDGVLSSAPIERQPVSPEQPR